MHYNVKADLRAVCLAVFLFAYFAVAPCTGTDIRRPDGALSNLPWEQAPEADGNIMIHNTATCDGRITGCYIYRIYGVAAGGTDYNWFCGPTGGVRAPPTPGFTTILKMTPNDSDYNLTIKKTTIGPAGAKSFARVPAISIDAGTTDPGRAFTRNRRDRSIVFYTPHNGMDNRDDVHCSQFTAETFGLALTVNREPMTVNQILNFSSSEFNCEL